MSSIKSIIMATPTLTKTRGNSFWKFEFRAGFRPIEIRDEVNAKIKFKSPITNLLGLLPFILSEIPGNPLWKSKKGLWGKHATVMICRGKRNQKSSFKGQDFRGFHHQNDVTFDINLGLICAGETVTSWPPEALFWFSKWVARYFGQDKRWQSWWIS